MSSPDYDKRLISEELQKARLQEYYEHVFSSEGDNHSPWNPNYINRVLHDSSGLQALEKNVIASFNNQGKAADAINYGENFRPHTGQWIRDIQENMNLDQFASINYDANNRAIATANLLVRLLPTLDPAFYHFTLPGQGYPFDNLQQSAIWAGTPVYIIAETKNRAWVYVLSPSFLGWVFPSHKVDPIGSL